LHYQRFLLDKTTERNVAFDKLSQLKLIIVSKTKISILVVRRSWESNRSYFNTK